MKIYVVYEDEDDNYYSREIGYFSTRDNAVAYIDSLRRSMSDVEFRWYHSGIGINEVELDAVS